MQADSAAHDADIRALENLNRDYLQSAEKSDVGRFDEMLGHDFLASNSDGSLIGRKEFLERIARPYPGSQLAAEDVRIRVLGDVALIHAGFKYRKPDGEAGSGRYTDAWARRQGRWLCVSAHFNRF